MTYPPTDRIGKLAEALELHTQLQHERGAKGLSSILRKTEKSLRDALAEMKSSPVDPDLAKREPSRLGPIRNLRPDGPRRLWAKFDREAYREKVEGALLGRFAGCTLGAPVELWPVKRMKALAEEFGQAFPPTDYWKYIPNPTSLRYELSPNEAFTRGKMDGVPVDDDIVYTLLGLLIFEEFGPHFTTEDVGKAWLKYLPYACTAEEVALKNLRAGVPAGKVAEKDNPYCEWIGADIRSDPWGYLAPGLPERAAEMAHRDAWISHRRQGIYGEMFFSAVIAAAFAVDDPIEAIRIGLTEIPQDCSLAKSVKWALSVAPGVLDYSDARAAVEDRFPGMNPVHTLNNACLVVFGLSIGGTDLTKVISETVAMGLDNDCTAATAGSIVGAIVGKKGIPKKWMKNFNDTVHSYLIGKPSFSITDLVDRFAKQAAESFAAG